MRTIYFVNKVTVFLQYFFLIFKRVKNIYYLCPWSNSGSMVAIEARVNVQPISWSIKGIVHYVIMYVWYEPACDESLKVISNRVFNCKSIVLTIRASQLIFIVVYWNLLPQHLPFGYREANIRTTILYYKGSPHI